VAPLGFRFLLRDASAAALVGRVVGQQDFAGFAWGGYQAGFGQFRQGVGKLFGSGLLVAVGGALHAHGVFGFLHGGVGLYHPYALLLVIFVLFGLAFLGATRHAGTTGALGRPCFIVVGVDRVLDAILTVDRRQQVAGPAVLIYAVRMGFLVAAIAAGPTRFRHLDR